MRSLFGGSGRAHLDASLLSAFLDSQITPTERTRIETHLQTCAVCRAELESLRHTVALVHALPRVAAPRAFTLSEVQVGSRRATSTPGWYGGAVRGLGAVAALALVAFITVTLLEPPAWLPGEIIARSPTQAATTAPAAAPAAPAAPAALEAASTQSAASTVAPAPAVAAAVEETSSAQQQPTPEAMLAAAPQPLAEENARSAASTELAREPALGVMAAKAAGTPDASASALGLGGGGPTTSDLPAEALTPEPLPPAVSLTEGLTDGVRMVYADLKALYAVDAAQGIRQVFAVDSINMPQLSPDQEWIVYRTFSEDTLRLWAIPWAGGEPRLLLDDQSLPQDGLPDGYLERHFSDSRWAPDGHILSVTLVATAGPDAVSLLPLTELWHLNVETGAFDFVALLERAYQPHYSPDGKRFATLQYGTETNPEAEVKIYTLSNGQDWGEGKTALRFTAGPGALSFEGQLFWTTDGQLLIGILDAELQARNPSLPNGISLHRITASAGARAFGTVDAFQIAWAPAGDQMVFLRYATDTMDVIELYLAAADGSSPVLYATTEAGAFMGWSPDGSYFLFSDNYQVFAGSPGQAPMRLANGVSLTSPRWVSDRDFVSLHDQGADGWWLTLRSVDGSAAGLLPLPREVMFDVVAR